MHQSSSRWRKPKKRGSKAGRLAAAHAVRLKASSLSTARPSVRPIASKEKDPQASTSTAATPPASTSKIVTPCTSKEAAPESTSKTASLTKIEMFSELLPLSIQSTSTDSVKSEYILIQRVKLEKLLASNIKCKVCAGSVMEVNIGNRQGFAEKVILKCQHCEEIIAQEWTSERISMKSSTRPPFKVNREMTSAFLSAGLGHAGMETFSASLGMNCMSHDSFSTHLKSLEKDILAFKESVLSEARKLTREIYELEDEALRIEEIIDVCVSYDGTWQKRGFTSLYGIGFVIDLKSGLVIDYEILSKHCYSCVIAEKSLGVESDEYKEWSEQHIASGTCNMNYQGSSPNMETEAAVRMWQHITQFTHLSVLVVLWPVHYLKARLNVTWEPCDFHFEPDSPERTSSESSGPEEHNGSDYDG